MTAKVMYLAGHDFDDEDFDGVKGTDDLHTFNGPRHGRLDQ